MEIRSERALPLGIIEKCFYDAKKRNRWYRKLWRKLQPKRYQRTVSVDVMDSIAYWTVAERDMKTGITYMTSDGVLEGQE